MALPQSEPFVGSLQLHTSPPSYVKASVPSEVPPTSPLRWSPAIASILSPPLPEPDSVPEFPILGGIQARGGRGMFAGSRHQGAWIVKRSQARTVLRLFEKLSTVLALLASFFSEKELIH